MSSLLTMRQATKEGTAPRVCVVSEGVGPVLDEGIKKFSHSVLHALAERGPALGLSIGAEAGSGAMAPVRANRLFVSRELHRAVRAFRPDLLCYVPSASDTVFSLLRLRVLSRAWPAAKTALVALQPRPHGAIGQRVARLLAPDVVFVQSHARASEMRRLFREVRWIPSGVDTQRFHKVSNATKQALRAKHGLPQDRFLLLHVGHITRERNVAMLMELQRRWQVVMVTGNSVGQDEELRRQLDESGVIVIDRYIDAIAEIYQAADCYVFPVREAVGSIEVPLSVLEAMACDLPVVTTPFGGISDMFKEAARTGSHGLFMAERPAEFFERIGEIERGDGYSTRALAEPFSWTAVAEYLTREAPGTEG